MSFRRVWHALGADRSGPGVARLFHRLLAACFLCAWISLGAQVEVLIGSRGLLPIAEHLEASRDALSFADFPTYLWLSAGDASIMAGVVAGVLLAAVALWGKLPRLMLGLSALLYLGHATACRSFLDFQWDNLLVECGILAALLPADRPAPLVHWLFRLLLFKVYFESGLAKWNSRFGDWLDGSAMSLYYETAPLPTPLGYFAHALPDWWHRMETWGTLAFETVVPWLVFGSRRLRLFALAAMTAFQVALFATSNYGFFVPLVTALGVFLLCDPDLERLAFWRKGSGPRPAPAPRSASPAWRIAATAAATSWIWISFTEGMAYFDRAPASYWEAAARPLRPHYQAWRFANTYHLFGHVTRDRNEPEVQTFDGRDWTPHSLRYKPGDPGRAPPWVAPHQPRVDFRIWFHGLGFRGGTPEYVRALQRRVCLDPEAMSGLFSRPLPPAPDAVRIVYWKYRFSTPEQRRRTGAWWVREHVHTAPELTCSSLPRDRD